MNRKRIATVVILFMLTVLIAILSKVYNSIPLYIISAILAIVECYLIIIKRYTEDENESACGLTLAPLIFLIFSLVVCSAIVFYARCNYVIALCLFIPWFIIMVIFAWPVRALKK